jgi:hypothetical protein
MNGSSIPRFVALVVVTAAMMVVSVAGVAFTDEGGVPNERASAVAQCEASLAHLNPGPPNRGAVPTYATRNLALESRCNDRGQRAKV